MKAYQGSEIRNITIAGHGDSGKTSFLAACLFAAGKTSRFTKVDEGTTITDFD